LLSLQSISLPQKPGTTLSVSAVLSPDTSLSSIFDEAQQSRIDLENPSVLPYASLPKFIALKPYVI
jgi:hypothetical protein